MIIKSLCSYKLNGYEIKPKYIVSTATIKNASEQIKAIYGRNHFQFPPSGLEASDSYFIREVPLSESPFRKYVGICANGSSMKTTLLRTFSAVLQEVMNLSSNPRYSSAIDPYYTLVGYFNSIRELGGAARLIQDDIPDRIKRICKMHKFPLQRFINNSKEITSRVPSERIKEELDHLEIDCYKDKKHCIDTVIATNMIAVGMDVDRLGVMCVLGQPKQNSEYIQATSRIGRSHPGLVISLYNPYRPIVYSFFDKKQSLLGFVTNEDILNYSTYIHVNIYSSKALPLYLITRIITYPNIDEFQLILLETRLLAKKTEDEYANILGLSTNEYQLLEQGSRTITSGYKREIQQKLNMIASSFSELFNEFLVEIGGEKKNEY